MSAKKGQKQMHHPEEVKKEVVRLIVEELVPATGTSEGFVSESVRKLWIGSKSTQLEFWKIIEDG